METFDKRQQFVFAWEGQKLSATKVAKLERALRKNPQNIADRLSLLGFYCQREAETKSISIAKYIHVLWMIDNCSDFHAVLEDYVCLNNFPLRLWDTAANRWQIQVEKQATCANVLFNAALFLIERDFQSAVEVFNRLEKLDNKNPQYLSVLCSRAIEKMRSETASSKRSYFAQIVLDKGLQLTDLNVHETIPHVFSAMSEAAFEKNDFLLSNKFANLAICYQSPSLYGKSSQEISIAYAILGLLAVRDRDTKTAMKNFDLSIGFNPLKCKLASELIGLGDSLSVWKSINKYLDFTIRQEETGAWLKDIEAGLGP